MSEELKSVIRNGILAGWNRHIIERQTAPDAMAEEVFSRVKDFVIVSEQRGYDRGQADAGIIRTNGLYDLCPECRSGLPPEGALGNWTLTIAGRGDSGSGPVIPPRITVHSSGCPRRGFAP